MQEAGNEPATLLLRYVAAAVHNNTLCTELPLHGEGGFLGRLLAENEDTNRPPRHGYVGRVFVLPAMHCGSQGQQLPDRLRMTIITS